MGELITIVHPKTGKTITMLRELVEADGIWEAEGYPLTEEDVRWLKAHLNPEPLREFMRQVVAQSDALDEACSQSESEQDDADQGPDGALS